MHIFFCTKDNFSAFLFGKKNHVNDIDYRIINYFPNKSVTRHCDRLIVLSVLPDTLLCDSLFKDLIFDSSLRRSVKL